MGIIPFQSTNLHRMHKRKERKFRQTGTGKSNLRPKDTRHAAHKEKSNDAILHLNTSCVTVSNSSSMHYQHGQKNENLLYFNLCNMHTVTSCITFFGWHTFWRMELSGLSLPFVPQFKFLPLLLFLDLISLFHGLLNTTFLRCKFLQCKALDFAVLSVWR